MKKHIKLGFLILAVCLLSLFVFSACGDNDGDGNQDQPENSNLFIVQEGDNFILKGIFDQSQTEVVVPAYVTHIAYNAFAGNELLKKLTFEDGSQLVSMDTNVFDGCTSLEEVELPESIKEIPNYTFSGCSSLAKITMSNSITAIGVGAFFSCPIVFDIPETVIEIGDFSFADSGLRSIFITSRITSIGKQAFRDCTMLDEVIFDSNCQIQTIKESTFSGCTSLTEICIPSSVETIERYAFSDCTSLKKVDFEENSVLHTIKEYAFSGCDAITHLTIPNSIVDYGTDCLYSCVEITHLVAPVSVFSQLQHTYNLESVVITTGTEIPNNTFAGLSKLSEVILPNTITRIGDRAFSGCNLSSFTIPSSVEHIGSDAFSGCNFTTFTIPANVKTIGLGAFSSCTKLESIVFESDIQINTIPEWMFANCDRLSSIEIPEGVVSIGANAFTRCYMLDTVVLPSSLTTIGESAFSEIIVQTMYVNSMLASIGDYAISCVGQEVFFSGTMEEWASANSAITAPTIHCSDGDLTQN